MSTLAELESRALSELRSCTDDAALREWEARYSGEVQAALKKVPTLPKEERAPYGQQANQLKQKLKESYEAALAAWKQRLLERSLAEKLDVTLPGRAQPRGGLHPSTQALRRIADVFA